MTDEKINVNVRDKNYHSVTSDGHLKDCYFKSSGQCICATLIKYTKAKEKRKRHELERKMERGFNSSSSDEGDSNTYNRAYRVGSEVLNKLTSLNLNDSGNNTAKIAFKESLNFVSSIKKNQVFDSTHNENNDQLIIQQMESILFSHLPNSNPIVKKIIKSFFTRLSIVALKESNNEEFKKSLTAAYQSSQKDPKDFASKLTEIIEESFLSQVFYSVQYFINIFTKLKNVEIQNESLSKSFIDKTIPASSQSTPKKILYPFERDTLKTIQNTNKSQASPLSQFIEGANHILANYMAMYNDVFKCSEEEKEVFGEIQAASIQDSNVDCNLLKMLTECSDFPKFAKPSNESNLTKKLSPSSTASSLKNKEEIVLLEIESKSTTLQNINKSQKKFDTGIQLSKKKIVDKSEVKSSEYTESVFISGDKYLHVLEKTSVESKKSIRTFFKEPSPLKEKLLNIDNIISPVTDYIDGKEMVVTKHERRHENSDKTKITSTTKKNLEVKKKSSKDETIANVENKVGYTTPKVIEDVVVDYSIYLTTVAKKKAFYFQLKNREQ